MTQKQLMDYAQLIIEKGVNLQENQELIIAASVRDAAFVDMLAGFAYNAKAKKVRVDWNSQSLTRLNYLYESTETLSAFLPWQKAKLQDRVEKLPAFIRIESDNPDGLSGIDSGKMASVRQALGIATNKYREQMDNKFQWCIAALPSAEWANKVFPGETDALSRLGKLILKTARAWETPLENWDAHDLVMRSKCDWLNSLGLKKLHFKNKLGTNLTVELPEAVLFMGGGTETIDGVYYQPNIPTEECFTSPAKKKTKGVVYASMPLSIGGVLVSDFGFRFAKGKVEEVFAKNEEHKALLEKLVATDLGSSYLGEVALVPACSPIAMSNVLFYNTLFDENASCHLALGNAYVGTIKDYASMTRNEINKVGINKSIIHVDFMFGTPDLKITGTKHDGTKVAVFSNGTWVS